MSETNYLPLKYAQAAKARQRAKLATEFLLVNLLIR